MTKDNNPYDQIRENWRKFIIGFVNETGLIKIYNWIASKIDRNDKPEKG